MLRSRLSTRLPDSQSVVMVFAIASLILYGWTFVSIFWKLNSWRMNLTSWEITSLISYAMILSFLQSAALLVLLLLLGIFLPVAVWKEKFMVRGSLTVLGLLSSVLLHLKLFGEKVEFIVVQSLPLWWLITALLVGTLVWILPRFRWAEKLLFELADRATVFLYIFLPLTIIGFAVLILRIFLL